jgi:hypothetical protein
MLRTQLNLMWTQMLEQGLSNITIALYMFVPLTPSLHVQMSRKMTRTCKFCHCYAAT